MTARIPLWLVRVAIRNASRFYTMNDGQRVCIGVVSSGDMLAWHQDGGAWRVKS